MDFGDLTNVAASGGTASSHTRSLYAGGQQPSASNTIQSFEHTSLGNASDFGDRTEARNHVSGLSNSARAVFMGGDPASNVMDYVTIASTGLSLIHI